MSLFQKEEQKLHSEKEFAVQLESRKETQNMGCVSMNVYRSYFQSVDSMWLIYAVAFLVTLGQIAISSIDLFVSKW